MDRITSEDKHFSHVSPFACSGKGAATGTSTFVPLLLVVVAFGVYLTDFGLRVEHVVIYPLFFVSLLIHAIRQTILNRVRQLLLLLVLFGLALFWLLTITWILTGGCNPWIVLANADNYAIPIAVIFVLSAFLRKCSEQDASIITVKVCDLLVIILATNSLMIIIQVTTGASFFFEPFMPPANSLTGLTVWQHSLNMGRYIGLFSTPFEAGITYTLGIFSWLYAANLRKRNSIFRQMFLLLMIIGGVLTVSKAFLLGLFIFIVYLLTDYKRSKIIINWRLILIVPLAVFITDILVGQWKGLDYFLRLFSFERRHPLDLISLYSAGRYGAVDSWVSSSFICVLRESPLCGFGLGNRTVVDSAYLYAFWHGGIVGLVIQLSILFILGWNGIRNFKYCEEGKFLTVLTVYVVIANLGAPVLTKNKFATVFWVIVSLLFMTIAYKRRRVQS